MDDLARFNKERWDDLARAGVEYSKPWLGLDEETALLEVDPFGFAGEIEGKEVLCLGAGGGQQSAAFGLLGAWVTVWDLSETQLERDRLAAAHYGYDIETIQGDIRDLSQLEDKAYDIVWHGFSINFVPEVGPVLDGVVRVLRPAGLYYMMFANPFIHSTVDDESWDGVGYRLRHPYIDGQETSALQEGWDQWDIEGDDGGSVKVQGPKEFRHYLSTVVNGLADRGFVLLRLEEDKLGDPEAEPGSWPHLRWFSPPWLHLWAVYRPDVFGGGDIAWTGVPSSNTAVLGQSLWRFRHEPWRSVIFMARRLFFANP